MSDISKFQCRFYENKYPEIDDIVMVYVHSIGEMGAYVRLLEYNNIEGLILLSELSRRRIRSVQKLIRVGRHEVAVVLRVDKDKGYIDLSKRRVTPEDISKCEDRFNKAKAVHVIMRYVAEKVDISLETLYTKIGWPMYKKHGHAYEAFKLAITEGEKVFGTVDLSADVMDELMVNIRRRLTPMPVKFRADIEVTCFSYEGIEAIREALKAGEAVGTEDVPIKIRLLAPPVYVMNTQSLNKQEAMELMEKSIARVEEVIRQRKGDLVVKMRPKVVSERDERELAEMMERAERENKEVAGDDEDGDDSAGEDGRRRKRTDDEEEEEDEEDEEEEEDDNEDDNANENE